MRYEVKDTFRYFDTLWKAIRQFYRKVQTLTDTHKLVKCNDILERELGKTFNNVPKCSNLLKTKRTEYL